MKEKLKQTFSAKRQLNSFKYALKGIAYVFINESNMHIHLLAAVAVVAVGIFLDINNIEWCLVIICIGTVMAAEMINTAIELSIDLLHPDKHPIAGRVKDVAAGAVMLCAIVSVVVACFVFLPKVVLLLKY